MPSVEARGREFNYVRRGSGEPLLMIQGMSGTHLSWGEPFSTLLEESFDCIAFDNRGVGLSGPADEQFTITDLADDTFEILDALEVKRAHVLGISMGGMVAQELALAHPDRIRSLILGCTYCGGPGSKLMDPADFAGLVEAMGSGDADRVLRASYELNTSPGFRADPANFGPFREMASALPIPRKTIGMQAQATAGHDTSARLPSLELPTLIIHGTEDRVLGYVNGELISRLIPAPLVTLDGVGHIFWWEQPQRAAELIREHAQTPA
jgi:3-oxoadipate enol-lactonase